MPYWLFQDFTKRTPTQMWTKFDTDNQARLEQAFWNELGGHNYDNPAQSPSPSVSSSASSSPSPSRSSSPPPPTPEDQAKAILKLADSHFQGPVFVYLKSGVLCTDSGDYFLERVEDENALEVLMTAPERT